MSVAMAVLCSGEVVAGTGEGGAATVEAVGVVDVLTTGLTQPKKKKKKISPSVMRSLWETERGAYRFAIPADPAWCYDTGQGHGACWGAFGQLAHRRHGAMVDSYTDQENDQRSNVHTPPRHVG